MDDDHECIKTIADRYDLPFYRPIYFTKDMHDMRAGEWAIKLLQKTPAGNVSKNGGATIVMNYCPFCGDKLTEADDPAGLRL